MSEESTGMFTFLDFFAGAGLVELGMGPTWKCAWANDNDPKKAEVYAANFDPAIYHLGDVTNVNAGDLPHGVDMAWASFPCQDLSLAGWRRGMSAARSGTFWAYWRIMRDIHDLDRLPPVLVIENVTGLLNGPGFVGLCEALAGLGLRFGAMVIDARRFVPQSRPRAFIVAVDGRADTTAFEDPEPRLSRWFPRSVWTAYRELPEALKARWTWWALPAPADVAPPVASIIETEPAGVHWNSDGETARLIGMMSGINLARIEQAKGDGGRQVGLLYKRTRHGTQRAEIRFDGVAGCLRTPSGGSSRQTVVIVEDGTVRSRLLSAREAARLMGVEDSFTLPVSYNQAYKAMGDAVAVPVVAWLSTHLLTPLAGALRQAPLAPPDDLAVDRHAFRMSADARANQWHSDQLTMAAASE